MSPRDTSPVETWRQRLAIATGLASDDATCERRQDQLQLYVARLGDQIRRRTALRFAERPWDKEEIPGSGLNDRRAREQVVADRVSDRTETEVVGGPLVKEELQEIPHFLLTRRERASSSRSSYASRTTAGSNADRATPSNTPRSPSPEAKLIPGRVAPALRSTPVLRGGPWRSWCRSQPRASQLYLPSRRNARRGSPHQEGCAPFKTTALDSRQTTPRKPRRTIPSRQQE